jgi:hypothetical protein
MIRQRGTQIPPPGSIKLGMPGDSVGIRMNLSMRKFLMRFPPIRKIARLRSLDAIMTERMDTLEARLGSLDATLTERMAASEARLGSLDATLTERMAASEARLGSLDGRMHTYFSALDHRGLLRPISHLTEDELISIRCSYSQTEHTNVIFAVAGSQFYGDYFEFGCLHLETFITTLNACRINDIEGDPAHTKMYYGFDVFGDINPKKSETLERYEDLGGYYADLTRIASWTPGTALDTYYDKIKQNGVYVDRCRLIKGFFDETFTEKFVANYLAGGRRAGFVILDCDLPGSHEAVFAHLGDILAEGAWIYLREGLERPIVPLIERFRDKLARENNLRMVPVRSAGAGGMLFRCYKR